MRSAISQEKEKSMIQRHQLNQSIFWLRITASAFFRLSPVPILLAAYDYHTRFGMFGAWIVTLVVIWLLVIVLLFLNYAYRLQKVMHS